jgi:hypothetical protein
MIIVLSLHLLGFVLRLLCLIIYHWKMDIKPFAVKLRNANFNFGKLFSGTDAGSKYIRVIL